MMNLVMANSGAEKAVLLSKQENDWFVQARKEITTDEHTALFQQPFDPTDRETELIPESVFNYCQRTKDVLVLRDAQLDHRFAEDRMVKKQKIQSIACLPSLSQGQLRAMLYLENSQTADVFTLENLEILKHLAAQFAVSVENAFLYDSLNKNVLELQESEAELAGHRDRLETLVDQRTTHLQNEIDERIKAEAALQESRLRFRSAFESANIGQCLVDPQGNLLRVNSAMCNIFGYSKDELESMTVNDITHPDDQDLSSNFIERAVSGEITRSVFEKRYFHKDGYMVWGRVTSALVHDPEGAPTYFISHVEDITESLQDEQALKASEEKYRDLVEKVSDVIYSVGADGVITYTNPAIEALIGLPPERVIGQQFTQFLHAEDVGQMQENIQTLLSGGSPGPAEYRLTTPSGETRWVRVTSQPISDGDQVTGLQGVLTDITERKLVVNRLEEEAATAERERLARRLHDAVTQTLFSASVIAESTPRIMESQ